MSSLITDPAELLRVVGLGVDWLPAARRAAASFPLRVPRSYAARIKPGDPNDPLLRQVLPLGEELETVAGYVTDPLQEAHANPVPGLLHKYHDRVLVTLTGACAIHCRYCFRRHFPYADNNPGTAGWNKIADYISAHTEINEIILSGGDPLSVSDKLLHAFADIIRPIKHLKRLRIHTRHPIVLPERVTNELLEWVQGLPFQVTMVVHANHAQEIDIEVTEALSKLKKVNVTLLNQSVLLRGVNDEVESLVELSEALFAAGVMPYYLHVLDKVQGAAHFDVPLQQAQRLHASLTGRLSGYLVPKLVREEAGKASKTLLLPTV